METNTDFVSLVQEERQRQEIHEGWTPEHDDSHTKGELARAGLCYLRHAHYMSVLEPQVSEESYRNVPCPADWPWDVSWWKPYDVQRDMIRGAALICAEGDRMIRAAKGTVVDIDDYRGADHE